MSFFGSPRSRTIALLGAAAFVIFAALAALQAFNTSKIPFLSPQTTGDILVFAAMSVIVFLLLMLLLVLLIRNILKLFVDQRSRALGSRLRTRLVVGAALIAVAPAAFMFLFSFQLLNRSVDRWFSQPTSELRENSTRVVLELAHYATSNARLEAQAIAASGAIDSDLTAANAELHSRRITLEGGFVAIYGADGQTGKQGVMGYQLPSDASHLSLLPWLDDGKSAAVALQGPVMANLLTVAQRTDEPILVVDNGQGKREYASGIAATPGGKLVVVGLPMPQGLSETASQIRTGASEYWMLFRSRNSIRTTYFFMLLLITTLVFFSSMWLALFLSKQITRPVEALADAMDEIADGKLDKRVFVDSSGEMAELVAAFNHMAQDLETSRHMAESSREQLSAANQALEERRRELETILETIPSGVVTLDKSGAILLANRAFAALIGRRENSDLSGRQIETLFPADCSDDLARVIRRSYRMGAASTEVETHALGRVVHLAVTSARLELGAGFGAGSGRQGAVLVVEDTTELLRAQRQLAWKEVAQRVAHEIKNPLTPIALSAERIRKHLDRATEDSPSVMRKCSEVILGCVGTLRTLVDQFAALAQFPAPQPRPCDMNQIAEAALMLFSGRLEGITMRKSMEPDLPLVMADPDAVKRALANLIDNAAEAMQGSLLRVLTVTTGLSEDGMSVEVAVCDTGHGLTDEIRERLFLPFYSTKQRGTGLGLSIAAKIAQEHHGSIRAEANVPKGARFMLCLPVMENTAVLNLASIPAIEASAAIPSLSE